MKKILLLLCILIFAVTLAHELCLDAATMQQVEFSDIPVLTEKEYRALLFRLPWMADSLTPLAQDQELPTDDSGKYYTPATEGLDVQLPARSKIARTAFETDADGNTTCRIIRYDSLSRSVCRLLVTGLPVLDLKLVDRESESVPIGDTGRELGLVRMFFVDADGEIAVQTEAATARVRGGTSRNYKKKSYAIAFVDETGAARRAQLLDMPADTEYGLNSLFEDDSKIRDIFSLKLWSRLDEDSRSDGEKKNAIDMQYTELLIDGQYWGLYGLHQLITPDALSLEKEDALFKINGYFEFRADGTLAATATEILQDTPDHSAEQLLRNAFTSIPDITETSTPTLDWDSALNYALLLELVCGTDSDTRNMAVCYRAEHDAFFMIGWDLDQSYGRCWTGVGPLYVENDFSVSHSLTLEMHDWKAKPFSLLLNYEDGFAQALNERYTRLRQGFLSDAALLAEADALFDLVTDSGARAREAKRWPKGGYAENNDFLQAFIPERMAFLDSFFSEIG